MGVIKTRLDVSHEITDCLTPIDMLHATHKRRLGLTITFVFADIIGVRI